MKTTHLSALIAAALLLSACHKKPPPAQTTAPAVVETPVAVSAPAAATAAAPAAPAAEPAELTQEQRQLKEKQAKLDFAVMEDKYINDPKAQWASSASASTTFGGKDAADSNMAKNVIGRIDAKNWTNDQQEIGFDTLETGYATPVNATEVRLVVPGGDGIEALTKVELQDTDGKWNSVWSGLSDVKQDVRGDRTWFVRSFPRTAYKVKAVKYTFANNVERGYKKADAAQLVGE